MTFPDFQRARKWMDERERRKKALDVALADLDGWDKTCPHLITRKDQDGATGSSETVCEMCGRGL